MHPCKNPCTTRHSLGAPVGWRVSRPARPSSPLVTLKAQHFAHPLQEALHHEPLPWRTSRPAYPRPARSPGRCGRQRRAGASLGAAAAPPAAPPARSGAGSSATPAGSACSGGGPRSARQPADNSISSVAQHASHDPMCLLAAAVHLHGCLCGTNVAFDDELLLVEGPFFPFKNNSKNNKLTKSPSDCVAHVIELGCLGHAGSF